MGFYTYPAGGRKNPQPLLDLGRRHCFHGAFVSHPVNLQAVFPSSFLPTPELPPDYFLSGLSKLSFTNIYFHWCFMLAWF
jgi:hypothetical protein